MGALIESLGINVWAIVIYGSNFLILLFALYKFAYKPILGRMDERADRIREGLEAAEKARVEAQQAQDDMRKQMEQVRQESAAVLEDARRASERFREEERGKARAELVLRAKARPEPYQRRRWRTNVALAEAGGVFDCWGRGWAVIVGRFGGRGRNAPESRRDG